MSQTEWRAWRRNILLSDELNLETAAFVKICFVIFSEKPMYDSYYTTCKMKNTI